MSASGEMFYSCVSSITQLVLTSLGFHANRHVVDTTEMKWMSSNDKSFVKGSAKVDDDGYIYFIVPACPSSSTTSAGVSGQISKYSLKEGISVNEPKNKGLKAVERLRHNHMIRLDIKGGEKIILSFKDQQDKEAWLTCLTFWKGLPEKWSLSIGTPENVIYNLSMRNEDVRRDDILEKKIVEFRNAKMKITEELSFSFSFSYVRKLALLWQIRKKINILQKLLQKKLTVQKHVLSNGTVFVTHDFSGENEVLEFRPSSEHFGLWKCESSIGVNFFLCGEGYELCFPEEEIYIKGRVDRCFEMSMDISEDVLEKITDTFEKMKNDEGDGDGEDDEVDGDNSTTDRNLSEPPPIF